MRSTVWRISLGAALGLAAIGCGDDDGPGMPDGGPVNVCPSTSPDRDNMMPPCCYRASNAGRLDQPDLRVAAFLIEAPASIANAVVNGVLSNALDTELFNWLIRTEVSGDTATITTGYGVRSCIPVGGELCPGDSTFAFDTGGMFPPITIDGAIAGEVVTSPQQTGALGVPVFEEDGVTLQLVLPLENLTIENATFSEDRTCIGARRPGGYQTSEGSLTAFITVEEATGAPLVVGTTLDTTLCMLLANMSEMAGVTCGDVPQADWVAQPDSICTGDPSTCTMGGCDPATDCNAWFVRAGFAAHGVEITN